jgi:hypothetical protein
MYVMMGIKVGQFNPKPHQFLDLRAPLPKDGPEHGQGDLDLPNRIAIEGPVLVQNAGQLAVAPFA